MDGMAHTEPPRPEITGAGLQLGLIGWPVAHSLSPPIHRAGLAQLGLSGDYHLLPAPPPITEALLGHLRAGYPDGRHQERGSLVGINITSPHKRAWLDALELTPRARAIGAINTVDLRNMRAENTDVIGFQEDLRARGIELRGVRTLVIGAGGAARAILHALHTCGAEICVTGRSVERVGAVIDQMRLPARVVPLSRCLDVRPALVVHATPVGTTGRIDPGPLLALWRDSPTAPRGAVFYDLVYAPVPTPLMRAAQSAGWRGIGGLGMLIRQAAASLAFWTGRRPALETLFEAARSAQMPPRGASQHTRSAARRRAEIT